VIRAGKTHGGLGMVASKRKKRGQLRAKLQRVETKKSKPRTGKSKATLLVGDALAVLKTLPKESIDLVVSSPPYNIGKTYERDRKLSFAEYVDWQDKYRSSQYGSMGEELYVKYFKGS
jgi:DNA modification methylase